MNASITAFLNDPIKVRASQTGRKTIETDRVFVSYWDGHDWTIGENGGREYRKMGHAEVMAFPLLDGDVVAHWHVLGEWHGLGNDRPDWPTYLDELGAYVPGNYGDLDVVEYND